MTPRIRTIQEAFNEIKANDPRSSLTLHSLKVIVRTGKISSIKSGKKYLLDLDNLLKYLSGNNIQTSQINESQHGIIRRIDS